MKNLGIRIKNARQYAGLTQVQLADACRTSPRQVQYWEAGDKEPAAGRIADIAKATGVTVNYLLGDFPRLPDTWKPMIVVATDDDTPQTAEAAAELLERATMEAWNIEEVQEDITDGWITFEDGALVVWMDGHEDKRQSELYRMLVK